MLFIEFKFFIFFIFVFLSYWALQANSCRKILLLLSSYFFYSIWDWRFLSLIIISTIIDYTAGLKIHGAKSYKAKKIWLCLSLFGNLGILGFFKYYNFFIDSFRSLTGSESFLLNNISIILPIGISFYTFQTLSYTLDIYYGRLKPEKNLLDIALFVGFFPQLVAGPIERARNFLPQLNEPKSLKTLNFKIFLALFSIGLFKKAVIADNLAVLADSYFSAPDQYTLLSSYIGVISYSIQIYCDFSGYSDC